MGLSQDTERSPPGSDRRAKDNDTDDWWKEDPDQRLLAISKREATARDEGGGECQLLPLRLLLPHVSHLVSDVA